MTLLDDDRLAGIPLPTRHATSTDPSRHEPSHIDRLYAQARQRRVRLITDELRARLLPINQDLDPETFEEEIALMAERQLEAQEERFRPTRLSRLTPV